MLSMFFSEISTVYIDIQACGKSLLGNRNSLCQYLLTSPLPSRLRISLLFVSCSRQKCKFNDKLIK